MKLLAALLLIGVTSAPALAGPATGSYRSRGGYAEEEKCYRREYREEYVPGTCLLYTSPSPRDATLSRMPSSA